MNVLLLNFILTTSEKGVITRLPSNHDTMIYSLARGFLAEGHSVTLCASEEFKPLQKEQTPFEIVWFPSRFASLFKPDKLPWPKGFRRWLKQNGECFDLIVTSEVFGVQSLIASTIFPEKTLVWHELDVLQNFLFRLPAKFWYNIVAPLFQSKPLVVGRSDNARLFVSRYLKNVSPQIVDHGADENIFVPSPTTKRQFVVVSQLIARKKIDKIIRAFADLLQHCPQYADFQLVIIGQGAERAALEQLCRSLGIEKNVEFTGRLSHKEMVGRENASVALLVHTERDLNMVSIPEAIVCGCPVVMNTVPTTAPFVEREGLGPKPCEWGWQQLQEAIERHPEFKANCLRVRTGLTNRGSASKMVAIARQRAGK